MKHIITVQHTQSIHHTNGMVGSWTDWDLTELGKIQADHIGKKLSDELAGKKVVLYSSDLKHAMQTAEEIAKYLGVEPTGGVSHMIIGDDGKHRVRHINDMSYITGGINQ